jgi:hypothetical protein
MRDPECTVVHNECDDARGVASNLGAVARAEHGCGEHRQRLGLEYCVRLPAWAQSSK